VTAEVVDTATGEISPTPYQLLPRLTDDENAALRADIKANGIRVPIDVDESGTIIDGHHRAWIAGELGVDCPRRVVAGLTSDQKRQHAIAVNAYRRQLSREARRELIAKLRDEGMSTRQIADVAGVPKSTVIRDAAEEVRPDPSGSPHTTTVAVAVVGRDGKNYQPQTLQQRRDLAAELRAEGFSIGQIADHMQVAKSTAQSLLAPRKKVTPISTKSPADTPRKAERIRELASQAWTTAQIARDIGVGEARIKDIAREFHIDIAADKAVGKTRRIDSNNVMQEIVTGLEQLALPMRLVNFDDLDATRAEEWVNSLTDSIRALNRFTKQIKELTQQ
jgi:ParB-like chromosome segregation protein Spo0J